MRNVLFALACAFAITSCNNSATDTGNTSNSGDSKKMMEANDAISNAFKTGNTAAVDSFVSDDFVDHTDRGDKKGKDSLKAMISMMHTMMTDMKMERIKEAVADDYLFNWVRYTGVSNGDMGMPKGPYDMHAIEVSRFKNGKAVEHWGYMDANEMMKMMGNGNMPGTMNKPDSTHK